MAINKFPLAMQQTIDFTSSGTFTVPADVYSAVFLVIGAGGGGGGADNSVNTRNASGGGGGGGAVKYVTLPTTPGNTYTITIGAKGLGGNATAGANAGFTEVVLSGTTLIQSYGGAGAGGVDATDAIITPTSSKTIAGQGGRGTTGTANQSASGGGGANRFLEETAAYASGSAIEGQSSIAALNASISNITTIGGIGINGFGAGGAGGSNASSANATAGAAPYGAGEGAFRSTGGATNGSNATLPGCGGGGATSRLSTTAATGGDGFDGLVRISYVG